MNDEVLTPSAIVREVAVVSQSLKALHQRVDRIEANVASMQTDTHDMIDVWKAAVGGLKVLGWLGAIGKWIAAIGAGCAAVYAGWKWGRN